MTPSNSLTPLIFSGLSFDAGPVDFETAQSFTEYITPMDRRADLNAILDKQREILRGTLSEFEGDKVQTPEREVQRLGFLAAIGPMIRILRRYMGVQRVEPMADYIAKAMHAGEFEKVVLFAIHRDVIMGLAYAFRKRGIPPLTFFGGGKLDAQKRHVQRFQETQKYSVFIGNIASCGPRVHLTAACDVFFVEQEWKPTCNAAALMRCHNANQLQSVHTRFVSTKDRADWQVAGLMRKQTEALMRPSVPLVGVATSAIDHPQLLERQ